MEKIIKFASDSISYFGNFSFDKRTRKLNELAEKLQKKVQPEDTVLLDAVLIKESSKGSGTYHARVFRFKFVFGKPIDKCSICKKRVFEL